MQRWIQYVFWLKQEPHACMKVNLKSSDSGAHWSLEANEINQEVMKVQAFGPL